MCCLQIQHKKQNYAVKLNDDIYLCNIPNISCYHPLFDKSDSENVSLWKGIDEKLTSLILNDNDANNILINGYHNSSKQILNQKLLSLIFSKFNDQQTEICQRISNVSTIIDALCSIQSSIHHYKPQCNTWLQIACNGNMIVGANIDLIGINTNIFDDVTSLHHIPIISMLKAYFNETESMYLSLITFNDKDDIQRDGFKEFLVFRKALQILNFTEERQQEIFNVFAAIAHLSIIEDDAESHIYAASLLLGIGPNSWRNVLYAKDHENNIKCLQKRRINGMIRYLYLNTMELIIEHINTTIGPKIDVQSSRSIKTLTIFDIEGIEYDKPNHNKHIDFLCSNYIQEILNDHVMDQYVHRINNKLYKEGIVRNNRSNNKSLNIPSLIGSSSNSILSVLDIVSNDRCSIKNDQNPNDFVLLLNDRLESKIKVSKENKSFVISHCFGDIEYDTSQFSQRNRYCVDANVMEVLSNSENMLVRDINANAKCKRNSFMKDFIAKSSDIMQQIASSRNSFMIYCFESNKTVTTDDVKFDVKHIWNQLCCYPSLFEVYYLSLQQYQYLSVSYLYDKFKPLFEDSDYFCNLAENPMSMIEALFATFDFLQSDDYKISATTVEALYISIIF